MGRKLLLDHLITPEEPKADEAPLPPPVRKPMARGVGLVGAMTETVEAIQSDLRQAKDELREAQERVEGGELIIEIATDLIDPSFVADRLNDDQEMGSFVTSIRDQGQRTPILVRPHPDVPGRYQIAFGHRRYRALKIIGRPVRAMVKPLSDEELIVAQGQENQDRLDLSYIERALFAARLEASKFTRDIICSAMSIDKTEVSRMIKLANALPDDLVQAIGPAQTTGRRRWMELAQLIEQIDWAAEKKGITSLCRESGEADSDARFDLVLKGVSNIKDRSEQAKASPTQDEQSPAKGDAEARVDAEPTAPAATKPAKSLRGVPSFKVDRKAGVIRIRFDETNLTEDMLEELMSRVRDVCSKLGAKS